MTLFIIKKLKTEKDNFVKLSIYLSVYMYNSSNIIIYRTWRKYLMTLFIIKKLKTEKDNFGKTKRVMPQLPFKNL